MSKQRFRNILKLTSIAALVAVTLIGLASSLKSAHAAGKATYNVIAGSDTPYGYLPMGFYPQTIKVHKGDTVTWNFRGFHDVRFDQKTLDIVTVGDIDGKKLPEFNPAILLPNAKSGDVYKPGAGSGVQVAINPTSPTFSMVMDVAPGTYNYLCDVHVGMVGTIIVVDDATTIPSPADVDKQGENDVANAIADGDRALLTAYKQFALPMPGASLPNHTLQISAGLQQRATGVSHFFPEDATIGVGQSVTWTVPKGYDIHTVNFPLSQSGRLDMFGQILDSKNLPHAPLTDAGNANVKSGAELPADGIAKSGVVLPGQSFTLKFTKPGIYEYYCAIHEDMFGFIEVEPPQPTQ